MAERDEALAETAPSPSVRPLDRTATQIAILPAATTGEGKTRQIGRYHVEKELGVGGMGIVHAAFDPDLERRVALKLILRATSQESRSRLLREARAMARLTHPNIVTIYEIGSDEGRDYVTMELVDGGSLADWLRAEPRSIRDVLDAFIAAARGLAAAHQAGIIHRDFKPHNVLRGTSGRIVVGDFGLATGLEMHATAAEISEAGHITLTATGSWVGTPAYMAPEQWNGGAITPATDQFAYCVALWEALAGTRPFRGDTVDKLREAVTAGPAKLDASAIPRRYRAALIRGLDPDPQQRWPTMDALIEQLLPSRRGMVFAGFAAAALAAAAIAFVVTRGGSEPERRVEGFSIEVDKLLSGRVKREVGDALRKVERIEIPNLPELDEAAPTAITIPLDLTDDDEDELDAETQIELLKKVKRVAGNVEMPRQAFVALIDELQSGKTSRLVPSIEDGQVVGLKVYATTPGTFVDAVGLANGDTLVAIDGARIETIESRELEIGKLLKPDADKLVIEILRREQPQTITVTVLLPPP